VGIFDKYAGFEGYRRGFLDLKTAFLWAVLSGNINSHYSHSYFK